MKTDLARDPATSAHKIDVETFRGDVQLNGFVPSAEMKAEATRVARGVSWREESVEQPEALAKATRSAGEVVDDAVITAKVKTALAADKTVAAHEVNVTHA